MRLSPAHFCKIFRLSCHTTLWPCAWQALHFTETQHPCLQGGLLVVTPDSNPCLPECQKGILPFPLPNVRLSHDLFCLECCCQWIYPCSDTRLQLVTTPLSL